MERVDAGVAGFWILAVLRKIGPFADEKFQISVNVLLKLADGFGAECVRNDLALASMLSSVTGVEETSPNRHEGVIVFTSLKVVSILAQNEA